MNEENCHFIGHLENEREACVAMTGCLGSENVEFTIMSKHASESPMFLWTKEGNVRVIEKPFKKVTQECSHFFVNSYHFYHLIQTKRHKDQSESLIRPRC